MSSTAAPRPSPQRLASLDALRGFDMMWIVGGDSLAYALNKTGSVGVTRLIGDQLEHVEWAGFHFYDLIFPLFVFIVGVSLVFSLSKTIEQHGRGEALKRIFKRSLLLFVVALLYSGGFSNLWPDMRLLGVLNRIALCYFFTSLLYCYLPVRGLVGVCAGLLVGYWALLSFVPFPDLRPVDGNGNLLNPAMNITNAADVAQLNWQTTQTLTGVFAPGLNFANYIDQKYLPGKKWDKTWDPEGLLSTLPAIASCLLGVFASLFLKSSHANDRRKVLILVGTGAASVVLGFAWSAQFPVVKKIWTSSFVLVAGGYSAILLGVFYQIVEVWKCQNWCQPFIWIGMNPITIYLTENIVGFRKVATRFLGGDVKGILDSAVTAGFGDLVLSLGEIGLAILLAWWLYRRKIFLRL
jgi:predicted acyltransferase